MEEFAPITRLLQEVEAGRDGAMDELMGQIYEDLERMARSRLRQRFGARSAAITLEPAALVNESFLKLIRQRNAYDSRGHFFAIASRVMLRVIIDYQRDRGAAKRGGSAARVTLSLDAPGLLTEDRPSDEIDVGRLAAALDKLDDLDPRKADVVRMKVVWGLENQEVAEALGASRSTVDRDWRFARAWMCEEAELNESGDTRR
jgi:RNA polymerase sigma factor (TIGR02999 family)